MTQTHTPGPWKVIGKNETQVCSGAIQGASGYVVAQAYSSPSAKIPYKDLWAECEANARLIAAAPDMLAALKAANSVINQYRQIADDEAVEDEVHAVIRAAIAKAEEGRA
jgi:hypothetical protein